MKVLNSKNTILLVLFFLGSLTMNAQCAMCRAVLQTEETGIQAQSINNGIVYLMAFPYLLLVFVGWGIYRIVRKKKKIE